MKRNQSIPLNETGSIHAIVRRKASELLDQSNQVVNVTASIELNKDKSTPVVPGRKRIISEGYSDMGPRISGYHVPTGLNN